MGLIRIQQQKCQINCINSRPFVFVDCIYANVRDAQGRAMNPAVYVVLGIDAEGHKDVLALQVKPTESKAEWMNLFDTLKVRGVKDILFLAMDGVSGLEDELKAVFPETTVQRCIVLLMRNSLKYINREDYMAFTVSIKPKISERLTVERTAPIDF